VAAIDQGIKKTFRDAARPVNLRLEYMDTKRTFDADYLGMLVSTYRHKFASKQFDAILTSDNNALDFLVRHGEELFPEVLVVFCGVNNFQDKMLQGKPGFTGAVEGPAFRETFE
jgi:two-component system, cell cycle sensor histidine kinase and response regulator CckA